MNNTVTKMKLAADVRDGLLISVRPNWSNKPVTAKIIAIRKRGSDKNKPFQFTCIAHIDNGK